MERKSPMLIFLDFDGVLHPQYDGQPTPGEMAFCHLPKIEPVFREHEVEIVISSSWRAFFPLQRLVERFSPDVRQKIVGMTPVLDEENGGFLPHKREKEILAWLAINNREGGEWLAVDDAVWEFSAHRDRLIACVWYRGFDADAENELRLRLETYKRQP